MEQLKNLLINSTIIRLEKDLAYVETMMKDESRKSKIENLIGKKNLEDIIESVRGIDNLDEEWIIDSKERNLIRIFYSFFYMIKEVV